MLVWLSRLIYLLSVHFSRFDMLTPWTTEELEADFTLHPTELDLIGDSKTDHNLLGFVVLLKYFQYEALR